MFNRRSIIGLGVVLGTLPLVGGQESAQADPPSLLTSMFKKKSDVGSTYQLKPDHGPWLIDRKSVV